MCVLFSHSDQVQCIMGGVCWHTCCCTYKQACVPKLPHMHILLLHNGEGGLNMMPTGWNVYSLFSSPILTWECQRPEQWELPSFETVLKSFLSHPNCAQNLIQTLLTNCPLASLRPLVIWFTIWNCVLIFCLEGLLRWLKCQTASQSCHVWLF